MASEPNENTSGSVQTSNVTTITISPNISGSGVLYVVAGGPSNEPVASGSAHKGPATVTVSGYDEYRVGFTGGSFGSTVAIKSGLTAHVTLAITTTQS